MNTQHYDVLIIGAGLSGVGMACHLAMECPEKSVALIERRNAMGGTWDLFRYPGIRSDSDMGSFGYDFRPWNKSKMLADGPAIRQYIVETAQKFGIEQKIRYGLKITRADWSSDQDKWTVTALNEETGETQTFSCGFLVTCTGYYNYDAGYLPAFPGEEKFKGIRIHPQHWPEDLDYTGKKVVVIGSGATAVTLVPAMAGAAGHVTMLQRSPSYIFSIPAFDKLTEWFAHILPRDTVYRLARRRNIVMQRWIYAACRRWPEKTRRYLLKKVKAQVGPDFDMRHFTPKYMPWDERMCAVPDNDLFKVLRNGKASVETGTIETFTETGIKLTSGAELEADIIVTATGLNLQMFGGMEVYVDGTPRPLNQQMTYKGTLIQNIPNLGWIIGYTNASWTLKADISSAYICRLLKYMDRNGLRKVTPVDTEGNAVEESVMWTLQSGYVQRAIHTLPRQGRKLPWKVLMHYARDKKLLLDEPIEDPALQFGK